MLNPDDVRVSEYSTPEDFKDFRCEKKGYSKFLQDENEAYKCRIDNLNITYVFKVGDIHTGYVTLAMGSLSKNKLPKHRSNQKRFRDVPSLLLGQIARDCRYKGQGVGEIMVDWVLNKAHELSQVVGCRLVIMHAELDKEQYYKNKFRFESIPRKKGDKRVLMFFDIGMQTDRTNVKPYVP